MEENLLSTKIDFASETNKPMLSVMMITYNHEKYIGQAIKSILQQTTDFEFEIVIGEDCSTDKTRSIICEIALEYPDKFKLMLHDKNLGMMQNFFTIIAACRGKYVAICEGDDYWIDNGKLQKQVNFLEQNPDVSICCHNVFTEEEDGNRAVLWEWKEMQRFSLYDLAKGNFISTPSVVFRRTPFSILPEKYLQAPLGDFILHLFNARAGDICYMPDIMAVYRIHSGGVWTTRKSDIDKQINLYTKYLHTNQMLLEDFSDIRICRISFSKGTSESLNQLRILSAKKGRIKESKQFARKLIHHMMSFGLVNARVLISCVQNLYFFKRFERNIYLHEKGSE